MVVANLKTQPQCPIHCMTPTVVNAETVIEKNLPKCSAMQVSHPLPKSRITALSIGVENRADALHTTDV